MSIAGSLARLRVRTKIIGAIALIGIMVLGGVYFAASRMRLIDDSYTIFLDKDSRARNSATLIGGQIYEARYFMLRLSDGALPLETKKAIEPRIKGALEAALTETKDIKGQAPAFAARAEELAKGVIALQKAGEQVILNSQIMNDDAAKELLTTHRPLFDKLSDDAAKLAADMDAAIQKGSNELSQMTEATIRTIWMVMGAIIAAGVLLGLLVSLLGITRPLGALVSVLQRMAKGEELDVVGADRKDEIGDTARAVTAIKAMIAEKAAAEAAEKADRDLKEAAAHAERERIAEEERAAADRRATAEREAEAARVMAEFDAAVGGIAKAAMAGDFSQRVPLEGKSGVIRNLAEAMNAMCDNIGKVMDDLAAMMGALAEGDLTKRIEADYRGAFGMLKDSANATANRLAETVTEIAASAREVANAAAEISTSTTDLSQRTEEQAAGLEQTSASMEEISATVKKNAENAQEANKLTAGTREVADRGGAVVARAVEAMSRIEDSSQRIADIIGVIDEIARQTNLLALNAAVEAARAGDAGRGFAVVASEVRSLAQRSSQAAKDIADLITSSSQQVKEGVDLVSRTGQSLTEIVTAIKSVADIVADIATASREQATGIDQVNKALTQMDEVTQQNSALVEENAATAKTLESQSAAMTEQVSFFRIAQRAAAPTNAGPRPAAPHARPAASSAKAAVSAPRGGIVGRMQASIATALKREEFAEF